MSEQSVKKASSDQSFVNFNKNKDWDQDQQKLHSWSSSGLSPDWSQSG